MTLGAPVELTLAGPAAGGTCVAHHDGATWFVRGGLPGEVVRARETAAKNRGRIRFAEVVEVVEASPDRVEPPCPAAGTCGGCDLQHVAYEAQLRWKSQVLADQLERLGRVRAIGQVPVADAVAVREVPLPGRPAGLGWRTRVSVTADAEGRACFHGRRSDDLVAVAGCAVAVPELQAGFAAAWAPRQRLEWSSAQSGVVVAPTDAVRVGALPGDWVGGRTALRTALGRTWQVAADGFWQSHAAAPDVLAAAVREAAGPQPGEAVVDLYCGVGLFAGALAADVGERGSGIAVEGDHRAAALARRNLADLPQVRVIEADVKRWVSRGGAAQLATADAVVLDPPRTGAGADVIARVAASERARVIVYVACDGASLARDAALLRTAGWELAALQAFDLFGMSHHVEAVARFVRA
ncbi:MAG: class I SAM-dependent RNA methyltransferase [Candidatus Nanopelagicales bacterium]